MKRPTSTPWSRERRSCGAPMQLQSAHKSLLLHPAWHALKHQLLRSILAFADDVLFERHLRI